MKSNKNTKVIKRYSNRKLYDTSASRYVTLGDISRMVKSGADIQVIDNNTREDITSGILAQIVLEGEKVRGDGHINILRKIIQNGGETLSELISRKKPRRDTKKKPDAKAVLKGFADQAHHSLDELQAKLDEFLNIQVNSNPVARSVKNEIEAVQDKLKKIEERLKNLRKGL